VADESVGGKLTQGTVKLPGIGQVRKPYVIIGGLIVGVATIIYYRRRKAAQQAAAAGTITTDSAGNVGVIDPATGFVYGSQQDMDALNAMAGTGTGTSTAGSGGGGTADSGGDTGSQVSNGPPFTNNAAWSQYVTAYLVGTVGRDPGTVATDLGAYLAGAQITQAARDDIVQPALAYGGLPPVAGPNGMPPSMNVAGSVSNPVGTPGAPTLALGTITDTSGVVKWSPVSGATGYTWQASGPSGFSKTGTTTSTSVTLTGLHASSSYTVTVHARNSAGAGPDAHITVNTKSAGTSSSGSYAEVHVVTFVASNPAWNSTLSGIAQHYGYGSDWQSIWNDPRNASLRAKRGQPQDIRDGDTVWVKRK